MNRIRRITATTLLALALLTPAWWLLTPLYNRYLLTATENVLHLLEHPNQTRLAISGRHDAVVVRRDFPPSRSTVYSFRVTDLHFSSLLAAALLLATPTTAPLGRRVRNAALSSVFLVPFHILLALTLIGSAYALRLGDWSLEHYGPIARNALALAGHLLNLPFKLSLPLLLWAFFTLNDPPNTTSKKGAPRHALFRRDRHHRLGR